MLAGAGHLIRYAPCAMREPPVGRPTAGRMSFCLERVDCVEEHAGREG